MTTNIRPLLVELLTEELPAQGPAEAGPGLCRRRARHAEPPRPAGRRLHRHPYSTPRRLAVHLSAVLAQAPDQAYAEKLMPAKIGLTEDGKATPALQKKLAAKGRKTSTSSTLDRESDGKQDYLVARHGRGVRTGRRPAGRASKPPSTACPSPRPMRYQLADGVSTVKFVRPAHGLIALFGADVVPVSPHWACTPAATRWATAS